MGSTRAPLRSALNLLDGVDPDDVREAVAEAEHAIQRVLAEGVNVPLAPRPSRLRKLQHKLVTRYHLETASLGSEPLRHLVIYPVGALVAPEPGEQALQEADEEPFEESSDDAGDALEELSLIHI